MHSVLQRLMKKTRGCVKMNWTPKVFYLTFGVFRLSEGWEMQPMAFFYSSQYWESRFSPIFCFPNVGKAVFRWFLLFPCEEKPIFANFWFSPARESRFSSIFVHRTPLRKPPFLVFCSSYPYESLLLPFFVHRTPTKASFSRFLLIVPRIWVIFRENRWFAPVSE